MRKRRRKGIDKKLLIIKILAIAVISGFVALFVKAIPERIIIRSIKCQSQYGPCNQNLTDSLGGLVNQNIRNTKESLNQLLSESIIVKQHSFQFLFPNKIKVNIVENKPIYALKSNSDSFAALITKEGSVISKQDRTNLPVVEIQGALPQVGEKVDDQTLFALDLVYGVNLIDEILISRLNKDKLEVDLAKGIKAVFPLSGDRDVLLGSLNLVLTRLNSQDENFRIEEDKNEIVIDLRFKNPVIK